MKRHLSLAICTVVVVGLFAAGVANAAMVLKVGHIAPLFH